MVLSYCAVSEAGPIIILSLDLLRVDKGRAIKVEPTAFDSDEEGQNHILVQVAFGEGALEGRVYTSARSIPLMDVRLLAHVGLLLCMQIEKFRLNES